MRGAPKPKQRFDAHRASMDSAIEPGPGRIAEIVSELINLTRTLDELPDRVHRTHLLSRIDGWSHADIKEIQIIAALKEAESGVDTDHSAQQIYAP